MSPLIGTGYALLLSMFVRNRLTMHERSALIRIFWFAMGVLSLVVGLVGLILPLLPGIPFLILAAVCMAQAFKRDRVCERLGLEEFRAWRRRNRYS